MDLRIWQTLAEAKHEELIRLAGETDAKDVAAVARLRKLCPDAELARAALMLAEARRKAVPKFGAERAATLWADPAGVEMATSHAVACHKGSRIESLSGGANVHDLCCGIGGDTIGMCDEGVSVRAFDADPVRAWMAGRNSGAGVRCMRVEDIGELAEEAHIDPARRSESGERSWRLEDMRPEPDVVAAVIERYVNVAVKLGPGVDVEDLPANWVRGDVEMEYISEDGRMTQAVLWTGGFALRGGTQGVLRRATVFSRGSLDESIGRPEIVEPPVHRLGRYLAEPDPAIERARQVWWLCKLAKGGVVHPGVGILTSDAVFDFPGLPWFEVIDSMPWHERKVKAALDALGAGIVEVKTRGKAADPDVVQMALRGRGDRPLTVFILRFGREVRAIIANRLGASR